MKRSRGCHVYLHAEQNEYNVENAQHHNIITFIAQDVMQQEGNEFTEAIDFQKKQVRFSAGYEH